MRRITGKRNRRSFAKLANRKKAANLPISTPRGGRRL